MNDRRTPTIPVLADRYGFVVHELDDCVVLVCVRGKGASSTVVTNDDAGRVAAEAWFMSASINDGTETERWANEQVYRQIAEIGR